MEDKSDSYVGGTKKLPKALKMYRTIAADGTEEEVSEGGQLEVRAILAVRLGFGLGLLRFFFVCFVLVILRYTHFVCPSNSTLRCFLS